MGTTPPPATPPELQLLVLMLPYLEQGALANATNFNWTNYDYPNATIAGVQINSLQCPSDPWQPQLISSATTPNSKYSVQLRRGHRVGGNLEAAIHQLRRLPGDLPRYLPDQIPTEFAQFNGVISNDTSTKIASITDGTSNTLLFGEHAITLAPKYGSSVYFNSDGAWRYHWFDTMFSAYYPPNVYAVGTSGITAPVRERLPGHGVQLAPWWGQLCVLRRLGEVPQEHNQLLVLRWRLDHHVFVEPHRLPAAGLLHQLHLYDEPRRSARRLSRNWPPSTAAKSSG